jgi:subtilisin family serine protease
VEYVERVPARWILAKKRRVKSDPSANRQWGLAAIEWFGAGLPSASTVNVAVLDTGIDDKHPDLKANIASYTTNGFSKTDIVGHGTHVAGIIAAVVNNDIGIAGIAQCRLHAYKIFSDTKTRGDYYVDQDAYLRSLIAAVDSNCKVINLSIGGTEISRTEQLTLGQVIDRGCTVVAAMGNEFNEGNPKEYPGGFDGVVAVGATDQANRKAPFSNTGKHIHLVAPGVEILSTLPMKAAKGYRDETEYAAWDGTSMATPHVAGAVALLLAKNPSFSPAQVRKYLQTRSAKVAAMRDKSFTQTYGYGLLNIPKLLK